MLSVPLSLELCPLKRRLLKPRMMELIMLSAIRKRIFFTRVDEITSSNGVGVVYDSVGKDAFQVMNASHFLLQKLPSKIFNFTTLYSVLEMSYIVSKIYNIKMKNKNKNMKNWRAGTHLSQLCSCLNICNNMFSISVLKFSLFV
ncbi:hypothetical protein FNV43_RR24278 [Rhamnella rubrinervis]|uniref:Uncharacterized protein n=1 Tax=Rhamnella rubrinervis TaxID=2594499 RepID=A0A8K0DMH2_9ROSA|nr:hypothetical protein FNV43_RR24278 [Rhamnella rubrinervis]